MDIPFTKYVLSFVLVVLTFLSCNDNDNTSLLQNIDVTSVKIVGGSNNDSAQSVISTLDGGYAVLGYTQSNDGDVEGKTDTSFDYWLLKYNAENELDWQNTYGGTSDDRGIAIIQTQDNGYAILGSSTSNDNQVSLNNGLQDFWLAKLNTEGTLIWQKTLGFQGNDIGISLIQTNDLGYLLIGVLDVSASGGNGNINRSVQNRHAGGDYWIIKMDNQGNTQWARYFGGNFTDTPEAVVQTKDNGYMVVGSSDSSDTDITNNIGSYDFWVIKIDNEGELLWQKNFGGSSVDEAKAIAKTSDGNYIIAGDTRSTDFDISSSNGAADVWLIKIDDIGNLLWEKTYGGSSFDTARSIINSTDDGFIVAGSSRSSTNDVSENKGQNDVWVFKINSEGQLLWETSIGGSSIDFGYGVASLNDNSIVVVGDSTSNDFDINENKGFTDAVIVKME